MHILGYILVGVGGLLFFVSKWIYLKNDRKISLLSEDEDKDFLQLMNKNLVLLKAGGTILVIAGGFLVFFID